MGQLEKYGLYVLCLVIFLILGVAIWGGEPQAAGGSQALPLAGTDAAAQQRAQTGRTGRGPTVNSAEVLLDMFSKTDLPKAPAKEPEKGEKGDDKGGGEKAADKGDKGKAAPAPDAQRPKYPIKPGDTLEEIAIKQLGSRTLVDEIKKLNPGIQERNLKAGSELVLPSKAEIAALVPAAKKDAGKEPVKEGSKGGKGGTWRWYTFESGDTYERVSKKLFHDATHVEAIKKLNPTLDPNRIPARTEIKVPVQ